jgi:hypothetical protein
VTLAFPAGQASAILTLDGDSALEIGLDQVDRFSPANEPGRPADALIAARGGWKNDTTFVFNYYIIGSAERYTATLLFEGDTLDIRLVESNSNQYYAAVGERVG